MILQIVITIACDPDENVINRDEKKICWTEKENKSFPKQ